MNQHDFGEAFANTLKEAANDLGVTLKENSDEWRQYAADQLLTLQTAAGQPGYFKLVEAAARASLTEAAGHAVDVADAADARLWSLATGLLTIGAQALAPA